MYIISLFVAYVLSVLMVTFNEERFFFFNFDEVKFIFTFTSYLRNLYLSQSLKDILLFCSRGFIVLPFTFMCTIQNIIFIRYWGSG